MKVKEGEIGEAKKSERYREMGRRLGTLAYFIYFNDVPFKFPTLVYVKRYRYG